MPTQKVRPVVNTGPGLTKQEFKDACDINKIIAKYEKTGMIEALSNGEPFYGDVSNIKGYQEAVEKVQEAQELFYKMSPVIREKFDNDPEKMINFLDDKKNYDEALKLGMVVERPKTDSGASTPVAGGTPANVQP